MTAPPQPLDPETVRRAVRAALDEDLGATGDLTSAIAVPADRRSAGSIVARSALVLAGIDVAREVFRALDPEVEFLARRADGERLAPGELAASLGGPTRALLAGERTALNFLMRMCGIASATADAVHEVAGTSARILDTRKTAPGLRRLDKYAVACGGGLNHRMGLHDALMLKDTHLDSGCSIEATVREALARGLPRQAITVEARDLETLQRAICAGAGRVLLDNMSVDELRRAVRAAAGRVELEASGGLRPGGLAAVAATGVDYLSLGWLTHSAPAADLALELERAP